MLGLSVFILWIAAISGVCAEVPTSLSDRVLVVFNSEDAGSRDVAKYYAKMRASRAKHVCHRAGRSRPAGLERVLLQVKAPVKKCLTEVGREKILYIVLTTRRRSGSRYRINEPSMRTLRWTSTSPTSGANWDRTFR